MITRTETEHIATLARLDFSDAEYAQLTDELNSVIGYISQLSELDVSNVAPLENINESVATNVFRPDKSKDSLRVEDALKNAPKSADGFFLVPKVIVRTTAPTAIDPEDEEEVFDL